MRDISDTRVSDSLTWGCHTLRHPHVSTPKVYASRTESTEKTITNRKDKSICL